MAPAITCKTQCPPLQGVQPAVTICPDQPWCVEWPVVPAALSPWPGVNCSSITHLLLHYRELHSGQAAHRVIIKQPL